METTTALETRWLIRRDMPEIIELEQAKNAAPWTEENWLRFLTTRNHIGIVAETYDYEIVGALLYRLDRTGFEIEHLIAATTQAADALVERLKCKISQQRRTWLEAVVPERDVAAQLFFQRQGFLCVETCRVEYGDEDGYRMLYTLPD